MNLKIILSSDNSPIFPALEALKQALPPLHIELYCLCASDPEAAHTARECKSIENSKLISSFQIFTQKDFNSAAALANQLFMDAEGHILFLSSDVILDKASLRRMLDRMTAAGEMAGVNPILIADWIFDSEERIAFMGLAFDFQKKLHYLHEGILAGNPLAKKERSFQIANPGCLLLRCDDFRKAGGFRNDLGFLAFPALCLQILKFRPKGYICVPEAKGRLRNKFDSWSFCGAWNSILQRGRLETRDIAADYAKLCRDDGIAYSIDSWLAEGPAQIQDPSDIPSIKSWQEWSRHPKPVTLLSYLSSLSMEERVQGVGLARNRPSSLPQTLRYYKVQADKISARAKDNDPAVAAQIDAWHTRIRRFHYGELRPGIELLKKVGIYDCSLDTCPAVFDAWVEIAEKFERLEISESWPEIAVVMPVWNPRPDFLRQAVESVISQTYPNWQLCIADDASMQAGIRPLLEKFASEEKRIQVTFREKNGHICRATNSALELVTAPFAAFLDHDDLLSPHALGEVASAIAKKPELAFIYSDDDRIDEYNVRRSPLFRPDYDCDLLCMGHLSTLATNLARELGGLQVGTEGSQDQDLRLRAIEQLDYGRIAHIPHILYHWRVHEDSTASSLLAKPYALEASRKIYLDAAARQGRKAEWAENGPHRLFRLLHYPGKRCLCSVILLVDDTLPSKALLDVLKDLEKYVDVEIYIQPLRADSPKMKNLPSLRYAGEGIAVACDGAAARANGEVVLFLSASLEPDQDCRLEQLVELALVPHVAMASGNVWINDRLASGGWYPDADGRPFILLQGMERSDVKNSVWGQMFLPRHVLGSPWECMAVKKEICQAGEFLDESYGALATVDFALKAMKRNRFVAMNPWVNWQARAMPLAPNENEMRYLLDHRRDDIAACGLRNPNLRSAPDKDWTIIL